MLKAITFDFWNTLYKQPADLGISAQRIDAFESVLKSQGYQPDHEELRAVIFEARQHAHHLQREEGIDIAPRGHVDYILEKLHLEVAPAQWEELYAAYTRVLIDLPPEINDGVKDTLTVLHRKYRLAVICNTGVTPGVILRDIMKQDQIFDYFQATVFSDEVGWAKPNPQIFTYTLQQLQVAADEAAHIGDDSLTDVAGSKGAGMTAIWLAPQADQKVAQADYHLRAINQLLEIY